jgi:hypothetical protein
MHINFYPVLLGSENTKEPDFIFLGDYGISFYPINEWLGFSFDVKPNSQFCLDCFWFRMSKNYGMRSHNP